jgi:ABC-type uncharacterized transport system auxiliary subunit
MIIAIMKRARVSFLAILGVLLLSGCGPQSGNSENHSLSSEKGDSQETPDSSASSKSEGASSASSSSAVPTKATITKKKISNVRSQRNPSTSEYA